MKKENDRGSYLGPVMQVTIPLWFFFLSQALYGIFDLIFVGRFFTTSSVVAVSVGSQIVYVFTILISAVVSGMVPSLMTALGSNDREKAERIFGTALLSSVTASAVLSGILYLLSDIILSVMSTPEEAQAEAKEYLSVALLSLPAAAAYITTSSVESACGRSHKVTVRAACGCGGTVILSWIFGVKMNMGTVGIAHATLVSQTVCAVVSIIEKFFTKKTVKLRWRNIRFNYGYVKEILSSTGPESGENVIIHFSMLFITAIINSRGLTAAAAAGIVEKVMTLLLTFPLTCHMTSATLCAPYFIGERKDIRKARDVNGMILGMVTLYGILCVLIVGGEAKTVISLFTRDNIVIEEGRSYLWGYILEVLFGGIHYVYTGYLLAAGAKKLATETTVAAMVFIRIPLTYIASLTFPQSLLEVGLAATAGSVLSTAVGTFIYFHLSKKKMKDLFSE